MISSVPTKTRGDIPRPVPRPPPRRPGRRSSSSILCSCLHSYITHHKASLPRPSTMPTWLSLWESWHRAESPVTERVATFRILKTLCKKQRGHPLRHGIRRASALRRAPVAALTVHRTVIHYRDFASLTPKGGGKWVGRMLERSTKPRPSTNPLGSPFGRAGTGLKAL